MTDSSAHSVHFHAQCTVSTSPIINSFLVPLNMYFQNCIEYRLIGHLYTTSMVNAQGWQILKAQAKNSTTCTSIFYTTLIQSEMSMRCVYETFLHCTMLHVGGGGNKSRNSKTNFWDPSAPIWQDIIHVFRQFAM
jgi:hypothetical protein